MQTSHNYTYIPSPSSLSPLPASYPSRSSEYQTGLPVIHSNFPHPSILYPIMYTCWCYFFHLALTLPPKLCPQVHSLHLHLLSFPSDRFIDIIFLDYMCVCVSVLIYYVSFPDLLHYVQQALGPLKLTEIHSFLWLSNIILYIYILYLLYPFINQWASRFLPCPDYCKQCCDEHWGTCVFFFLFFFLCFFQSICPLVELLDHMVDVFLVFLRHLHNGWSS